MADEPTTKLTIAVTHQVRRYLGALVDTGLFGPTPEAAAERLIERGIARAIEDHTVGRIHS